MNDAPILDDLERDVLCAVRAKADQIDADNASFSAEAHPPRNVGRLTPARAPRRRALAAVAAVLVAAGVGFTAVDLAQWLGSSGDPDVTTPSASATGTRHTMRQAGTAGVCLALDLPAACTHRVPTRSDGVGSPQTDPRRLTCANASTGPDRTARTRLRITRRGARRADSCSGHARATRCDRTRSTRAGPRPTATCSGAMTAASRMACRQVVEAGHATAGAP